MHLARKLALLVVVLSSLYASASATAAPKLDDTFDLSGKPDQIAQGPDGNIWVVLTSGDNEIAKVEPDGTVTGYDSPDLSTAKGITAGPDDRIWVTKSQQVGSFDPADPTDVDLTAVMAIDGRNIVAGPNGNLWTTGPDAVVEIPPADPGNFDPHPVPGLGARGISVGGDGRIWVADFGSQRLIRMQTNGTFAEIPVGGGPQEITSGPGNQMAYTNPGASPQVTGLITPLGDPQELEMPNTDPFGITFANDGAYWAARFAPGGNDLARITPQGKVTTLDGFPANSGPRYLAEGANNTLWVTLENSEQVAKITGVAAAKAPTATITKAPKSKVKTKRKRKKAKVKFVFESSAAAAKFQCSLEKRSKEPDFGGCKSPASYKLKRGKYEFQVRAKANGLTGKPDTAKFKVVKP